MSTNAIVCINLMYNNPLFHYDYFNDVCNTILQSNNKVIFVIADTIGFYNYSGFHNLDDQAALKKTYSKGKLVYDTLFDFRNQSKYRGNIIILKWDDIKTNKYKRDLLATVNEYRTNSEFKEKIKAIVKSRISHYKNHYPLKDNHEQRFQYIVKYILSEIPLMLEGTVYKTSTFNQVFCVKYKDDKGKDNYNSDSIESLLDDITENKSFPNIHKLLYNNSDQHTILLEK